MSRERFTLQEKFLAPNKFPKTITIKEHKASGKPGAWYYCTAQLYFTAYYEDDDLRNFSEWMLASLEGIRRKAANGQDMEEDLIQVDLVLKW